MLKRTLPINIRANLLFNYQCRRRRSNRMRKIIILMPNGIPEVDGMGEFP